MYTYICRSYFLGKARKEIITLMPCRSSIDYVGEKEMKKDDIIFEDWMDEDSKEALYDEYKNNLAELPLEFKKNKLLCQCFIYFICIHILY